MLCHRPSKFCRHS